MFEIRLAFVVAPRTLLLKYLQVVDERATFAGPGAVNVNRFLQDEKTEQSS